MMYYAHTLLWPLLILALAGIWLFLLDFLVSIVWPKVRLRRLLFDKRFRERHPIRFLLNWMAAFAVWFAAGALMDGIAKKAVGYSAGTALHDEHDHH